MTGSRHAVAFRRRGGRTAPAHEATASRPCLMRTAALFAIKAYQRYVSPYKGFCCAYRAHTGRQSCSALGYRAIRRYGFLRGIAVLDGRFTRCAVANERRVSGTRALHSQRGVCDLPCAIGCDIPACDLPSCDVPSFHCPHGAPELVNCCPSPCDFCDWPRSKKRSRESKEVYIPPQRSASNESRNAEHRTSVVRP